MAAMDVQLGKDAGGRIFWLDYAKVCGMFLVILGHCYPFASRPYFIRNIIYLFHMPLFFFVSGMLFKPLGEGRVKKAVCSLVLPAIAWNLVWIAVRSIWRGSNPLPMVAGACKDTLLGQNVLPCSPSWFLFALFWCQLLACMVARKSLRAWGIPVVAASWLAMRYLPYGYFGNAAMAMPFFLAGIYSRKAVCAIPRRTAGVVAVLATAALVAAAFCFGPTSMRTMAFGNFWRHPIPRPLNIPVFYAVALVGIAAAILPFVALDLPRNRLVERCSNGLIVFLCVHRFVRHTPLERFLMQDLSVQTWEGFGIRIGISLLLMALCYGAYEAIARVKSLSFLLGYRGSTGGR